MDKKKDSRLEITELFMAKAGKQGWDRCFHGTIKREIDESGDLPQQLKAGSHTFILKMALTYYYTLDTLSGVDSGVFRP
jgi:hypothetical protein